MGSATDIIRGKGKKGQKTGFSNRTEDRTESDGAGRESMETNYVSEDRPSGAKTKHRSFAGLFTIE